MTILLVTLSLFLVYLTYERLTLDRLRRAVPLIIAVTGTRGKSTVVRLLASVLREHRVVLAKSTGSEAHYVLPDGSIERVPRRGVVTILEQKDALRKAVKLKADCLVIEIMSIRPENHFVESQRILKPNIVVLTNVRRDHTDAMGEHESEIARVFQLDLTDGAEVYVPERYAHHLDPTHVQERRLNIRAVPSGGVNSLAAPDIDLSKHEFDENLDLVTAVSRRMGIEDKAIVHGIRGAAHDIGKFRIWALKLNGKTVFAVNAFAANDPESTMKVLEKAEEILGTNSRSITGLLNLRSDRPDRTLQWIDELNEGMAKKFSRLFVLGGHANVVKRKVRNASLLASRSPDVVTQMISQHMEENEIMFGFGNIAGAGEKLVAYWCREGKEYGI